MYSHSRYSISSMDENKGVEKWPCNQHIVKGPGIQVLHLDELKTPSIVYVD